MALDSIAVLLSVICSDSTPRRLPNTQRLVSRSSSKSQTIYTKALFVMEQSMIVQRCVCLFAWTDHRSIAHSCYIEIF